MADTPAPFLEDGEVTAVISQSQAVMIHEPATDNQFQDTTTSQPEGSHGFIISFPADNEKVSKKASSTIRSNADLPGQSQSQSSALVDPAATELIQWHTPSSEETVYFKLDDSIIDQDIVPVAGSLGFPCMLYTADNRPLYTGKNAKVVFHCDQQLSCLHVIISYKDERPEYAEDVTLRASLRFPYFALFPPALVSSLGSSEKICRTQQGDAYEITLPLNMNNVAVENILVPTCFSELKALKEYLNEAKTIQAQLKLKVWSMSTIRNNILPHIRQLEICMQTSDRFYLHRWQKPGVRSFVIQHNEFLAVEHRLPHCRPAVNLERRNTFFNLSEYLIYMCIGDLEGFEQDSVGFSYWNKVHEVVLMQMPGQPKDGSNRIYLGFLETPEGADRLREGSTFQLQNTESPDPETGLVGIVTPPIPGVPLKYTTFFLPLRWDKTSKEFNSGFLRIDPHDVLPLPTTTQYITEAQITESSVFDVMLQADSSSKAYRNRVASLSMFMKPSINKEAVSLWRSTRQLLLAGDIDSIQHINPFSNIPDSATVIESLAMDDRLNKDQQEVFQHAQNAPAGFVLVKGPPGTGKSHTARALLQPFVMSGVDKTQVLLCGASNACVDNNAQMIHEVICGMDNWGGQYVVRVHAIETERSIAESHAFQSRPKPDYARPALVSELDPEAAESLEGMNIAASMHELYTTQTQRPFPGVKDPRVSDRSYTLSIGYRIMQLINVVPSGQHGDPLPPDANSDDEASVAELAELYGQYLAGEEFDQERKIRLTAAITTVRELVLKNAACICTTPALANEAKLYTICAPQVKAIAFDEAGRNTEQEIVAILCRYRSASLKCLIGDNEQIPPMVKGKDNAEVVSFFGNQLACSLLARLIKAGVPYVFLRTQYRMSIDICKAVSNLSYRGQLCNDDSVRFENRPMSHSIREWNDTHFARKRTLININVPIDSADSELANNVFMTTQIVQNGSRCNAAFVKIGINLAKAQMDLNSDASVAIMTGYLAQLRCFVYAKARLVQEDKKYAKLQLVTFDAAQGDEFDVTIVDFLVKSDSPGFLKSRGRVNVALSRARMGMYVIATTSAMLECKNDTMRLLNHELVLAGGTTKADLPITSAYFTDADFTRLTGVVQSNDAMDNMDDGNHGDNTWDGAEDNTW